MNTPIVPDSLQGRKSKKQPRPSRLTVEGDSSMKLLSFHGGDIILRLTPTQCATIARACRYAGEVTASSEEDVWLTLAVLFHACAGVGLARWQMESEDRAELDQALAENDL